MRFKLMLLVNALYQNPFEVTLPAGVGYLAEMLRRSGVECQVVDLQVDSPTEVLKALRRFEPEIVGVSMMSFGYQKTFRLIEEIREHRPEVAIAAGGPHVSLLKDDILKQCPQIDFAIIGEGETSLVELCSGKEIGDIGGLFYRHDGEVTFSGAQGFIDNIDQIVFPRFNEFHMQKYQHCAIPIVTSRGCPYSCIFCSVATIMGKAVRVRSAQNVGDEFEYWYAQGHRVFEIVDDNFTFCRERVYEICDEIDARKLKELSIACRNGVRADKVDRDLLGRMREVGFSYLSFGVEGGNDKILRNLRKGIKLETIERAIAMACELEYDVKLHFVVGAPGEKWEDIEDSLRLAAKYPIRDFGFYSLVPFPGTALYEWVGDKGSFVQQPSEYLNSVTSLSGEPVFETPELTAAEIKKAMKEAHRVQRRVRSRYYEHRLVRLGFLKRPLARLAASDFMWERVLRSASIRELLLKIYYGMTHRDNSVKS